MRLHWQSQLSSRVLHFKTLKPGSSVVKCAMSPGTWSVEVGGHSVVSVVWRLCTDLRTGSGLGAAGCRGCYTLAFLCEKQ